MIALKEMTMNGKAPRYLVTLLIFLFASAGFIGCRKKAEQSTDEAANQTANTARAASATPSTPFERDLQYVRDGQFAHIYVFSRKDGAPFDPTDIIYLKVNAPSETNQWVATDEKRRVIAGTNYDFTPEQLAALKLRFNVEDYTGR
jgi:hypothetical protein